jgi:hypothetical protein
MFCAPYWGATIPSNPLLVGFNLSTARRARAGSGVPGCCAAAGPLKVRVGTAKRTNTAKVFASIFDLLFEMCLMIAVI